MFNSDKTGNFNQFFKNNIEKVSLIGLTTNSNLKRMN